MHFENKRDFQCRPTGGSMPLQSHNQYIDQTPRKKCLRFCVQVQIQSNREASFKEKSNNSPMPYTHLDQTSSSSMALLDPISPCSKAILGTGLTIGVPCNTFS